MLEQIRDDRGKRGAIGRTSTTGAHRPTGSAAHAIAEDYASAATRRKSERFMASPRRAECRRGPAMPVRHEIEVAMRARPAIATDVRRHRHQRALVRDGHLHRVDALNSFGVRCRNCRPRSRWPYACRRCALVERDRRAFRGELVRVSSTKIVPATENSLRIAECAVVADEEHGCPRAVRRSRATPGASPPSATST